VPYKGNFISGEDNIGETCKMAIPREDKFTRRD